jgi:hypothetical protein
MSNHPTTLLASGAITNHDEITVILIEPTDGTPAVTSREVVCGFLVDVRGVVT